MFTLRNVCLFAILPASFLTMKAQGYFQQEVNYTIHVKLDDVKHELNADESIEYINNSPGELKEIYMHLWPNAYKDNNTALARQLLEQGSSTFYYASEQDRGYIDQLDFKVNGEKASWEFDPQHIDICKIILAKPLKSGDRITITTPFHVKLPKGIYSRLGHLDQAYQITQWYPKPAVYDKNGWNQMPYLNQGEFYSEFGSFDVSITLPRNYVVGATGDMVDGDKELAWLDQKVKETEAIQEFPRDMSFPASDPELKTLRFKQSRVHDFAWFADKRFHVLKGEVTLPHSGRKVTTWTMFTNAEAQLWKKSIEYMNDATRYYSLWIGDYPYNHVTAVDGALTAGAGMEYPNITVIGTSGSAYSLEVTIMHEVGHNWFYGVLGSNERKHAWMDEGINSFHEERYMYTKYPDMKGQSEFGDFRSFGKKMNLDRLNHKKGSELTYLINATRNADQPIEQPADRFSEFNYGAIVYSKTALIFDHLKSYLGDALFDKAMQQYYETWKFRHPQPEDVRKVFEEVSGKNLDWFFNDLIQTTKKLDYRIISRRGDNFTIQNLTGVKAPFSLSGIKGGQVAYTKWYDGFENKARISFMPGDTVWYTDTDGKKKFRISYFDKYKIDAYEKLPEVNRQNNTLRSHGLLKRLEPLKLQVLGSVQDPDKTEIYYFPVTGWNNYDKYMEGILLYNNLIPFKRFEYEVMPMFGFGSKKLVGGADIGYNWYPDSTFVRNVRLAVKTERFSYDRDVYTQNYNKIAPELSILFKNDVRSSTVTHTARIRYIYVNRDYVEYSQQPDGNYLAQKAKQEYLVDEFSYMLADTRKLNPYSIRLVSEVKYDSYQKAMVEMKYKINYPKNRKGVDLRLFAGFFLENKNAGGYFLRTSGFSGSEDYKYDAVFLGRSENSGLLSHQFTEEEGGLKVYTPLGNTNNWLSTLSVKAPMPGGLPVGLFADAAMFPSSAVKLNDTFLYDLGGYVSIGGILEVFFPFTMSQDIKDVYTTNNLGYREQIRFTLNLNRLNPFQLLKTIPY